MTGRLYRDEAVVLRTYRLGEADRIIVMLTRSHGQVRAVAKGVRRTTSRFGARLEPFTMIDVQLYRGRSLDVIAQVETLDPFARAITGDYSVFTCASTMVETAERLTQDDGDLDTTESPQQYLLLYGALAALARRRHAPGLVLDSYLLRALALAGWAPSCYDCARCGASRSASERRLERGRCLRRAGPRPGLRDRVGILDLASRAPPALPLPRRKGLT